MKKKILTLAAAAMLLTGCADSAAPEGSPAADNHSSEQALVGMVLEQDTFPVGVQQLRLLFGNNSDQDYSIGEVFTLTHTYTVDGKTVTEEVKHTENGDSFTAVGLVIPAHGKTELVADLAAHYEPLTDTRGHYTISVDDFYAEFFLSKYAE